ncbi:MAG: hypothetical protein COZ18_05970 [Flexibacter sp. CG_4_10_14_3_um_filter_32_15]|nr:MAG: hypothetical protein COZ18_05970 [Flexibacter sp. CG_4_10_14_3_um_filter_32_15]
MKTTKFTFLFFIFFLAFVFFSNEAFSQIDSEKQDYYLTLNKPGGKKTYSILYRRRAKIQIKRRKI